MSYPPSTLPVAWTNTDPTPGSHAGNHNALGAAVNDTTDELGSSPKGSFADLTARLAAIDPGVVSEGINTQTINYTLVAADAYEPVVINNGSARTVTVPPNSDVAFPIGSRLEVWQMGNGLVTMTAGAGVTLTHSQWVGLQTTGLGTSAVILKIATDTWLVTGDLVLAPTNWTPELFFGGVQMTYGLTPKRKGRYFVDGNRRLRGWFWIDLGQAPLTVPPGYMSVPLPVLPYTPLDYDGVSPVALQFKVGTATAYDIDSTPPDLRVSDYNLSCYLDKLLDEQFHMYCSTDGGTDFFPGLAYDDATSTGVVTDIVPFAWGDQNVLMGQVDYEIIPQ